jgi:hypothetical protein
MRSLARGLLAFLILASGAAPGAAQDPVLWNRLGSDAEVTSSEIGPDGIILGDISYSPGMFESGFKPDPRTGDRNIPDNCISFGNLNLGQEGTIEFWYQPDWVSGGHIRHILGYGKPDRSWLITFHYNDWQNRLNLGFYNDPTTSEHVARKLVPASTPEWSTTEPFHVAIVWNGNAAENVDKLKLYLNGNERGTFSSNGSPTFEDWDDTNYFYLASTVREGDWNRHNWEGSDGVIDNIKIWDHAKTNFDDRFDEGVGEPDPRTQGYWHRQCLGIPASEGGIDPGRNGRGPSEPREPDFQNVLMPAIDLLLQNLLFEFGGTCRGGMDAVPASDKCEKATKQYTALLLNVESGKLQGFLEVDLSAEGCSSTTVGELVDELAALINSNDPSNCQVAADCAAAVNEGIAVVEGSVLADEPAVSLAAPPTTIAGSSHRKGAAIGTVEVEKATAETIHPLTSPSTPPVVLGGPSDVDELEIANAETEAEGTVKKPPVATDDDGLRAIHRHLAVLANANAPERAREVSTDALLTALSGGYEPELRLEIVKGLLGRVPVAYESLLAEHLVDIRAEAEAFGLDDLADKTKRLLRQLELSED